MDLFPCLFACKMSWSLFFWQYRNGHHCMLFCFCFFVLQSKKYFLIVFDPLICSEVLAFTFQQIAKKKPVYLNGWMCFTTTFRLFTLQTSMWWPFALVPESESSLLGLLHNDNSWLKVIALKQKSGNWNFFFKLKKTKSTYWNSSVSTNKSYLSKVNKVTGYFSLK